MLILVWVFVDPAPTLLLWALVFAGTPFASFGACHQKSLSPLLLACHAELCFQFSVQLEIQRLGQYAKRFQSWLGLFL